MYYKKLNDLLRNKYFNRVIQEVEANFCNNQDKIAMYPLISYRYIIALIAVSRLEEAEKVCINSLNYVKMDEDKEKFQYLLSEIYFYSGKYHRFLALLQYFKYQPFMHSQDYKCIFQRTILPTIVDEFLKEKNQGVGLADQLETDPLKHIDKKHGFEFFAEPSEVMKVVKENFYKCPAYNDRFSIIKMFRCDNIGIFSLRNSVCNYVAVAACTNNPNHILSIYPTQLPGDMEYFDITDLVNRKHEDSATDDTRPASMSQVEKFRLRNMKRKN